VYSEYCKYCNIVNIVLEYHGKNRRKDDATSRPRRKTRLDPHPRPHCAMRVTSAVLLLASAASAAADELSIGGGPLTIRIDPDTGGFTVADGSGEQLLGSGDVSVTVAGTVYSHSQATLKLVAASTLNSTDMEGAFTGMNFTWATAGSASVSFETRVKLYAPGSSAGAPLAQHAVFVQHFPQAFQTGALATASDGASTVFPSLSMAAAGGRGVLSFQGGMVGSGVQAGQWLPTAATSNGTAATPSIGAWAHGRVFWLIGRAI
jgi:hypothetical protein